MSLENETSLDLPNQDRISSQHTIVEHDKEAFDRECNRIIRSVILLHFLHSVIAK